METDAISGDFFAKKSRKKLPLPEFAAPAGKLRRKVTKVFWFFFSKKNPFFCMELSR